MVILWILIGLLVLGILMNSKEHMTNDDLIATLKTFGEKGTKPKRKNNEPPEAPIYGPKAPKLQPPNPFTPPGGGGGSGVYPDIYGPEYRGPPGTPCKKGGKERSDGSKCDDSYQFNSDLEKAFPTDGEAPQPFLTDFSKFQH